MALIEVRDLEKTFPNGTTALSNINIDIEEGENVIVLGHNGSGKSTLFRTLTGFEEATKGTIHIFGDAIRPKHKQSIRQTRRRIGMVFQYFGLITNISVFQNVLFGALGKVKFAPQTYSWFASNELRQKAMECLERVGLSDYASRRADQLSGGQKQRVAIARMLMQDPEIILADEPIASLDPKAGREIMELLVSIANERGLTLVMILHQISIAKEFGDRVIALKNGEVILDGHVDDITPEFEKELFDTKYQKKVMSTDLDKDTDDSDEADKDIEVRV